MKDKIKVALKTKYKNLGFTEKVFNGVADYLSQTVTDDNQIETVIDGVENLLKSFQGEVDTVRNEKTGLQKKLEEIEKNKNTPDEVPDWFLKYKESNEEILKNLEKQAQDLVKKQSEKKREELISGYIKELDIPEWRMLGVDVKGETNEEIKSFLSEIKQTTVNAELPEKQGGFQVTDNELSKQEEKDFVSGLPDKINN